MSNEKYWDTNIIKNGLFKIINRPYIPNDDGTPAEDWECNQSPLADDMQKMAKRLLGLIYIWESGVDICDTIELEWKDNPSIRPDMEVRK